VWLNVDEIDVVLSMHLEEDYRNLTSSPIKNKTEIKMSNRCYIFKKERKKKRKTLRQIECCCRWCIEEEVRTSVR
jgi:hypothetical protein